MKLADFNYSLPKELIAQFPCERRDESRLMVLDRRDKSIAHKIFFELTDYLKSGDILVLNNTKVIPARLFGRKATGGRVEVLLIEKSKSLNSTSHIPSPIQAFGDRHPTSQLWRCLIKPSKGIRKGSELVFENELRGVILERNSDGEWHIELHADISIDDAIERIGQMPLPPYIKRGQGSGVRGQDKIFELDRERYQTVFAMERGAVAAPTAGLHFTEGLLKKVKGIGAEIFYITLHTGLGTFMPVKEEDITKHKMMPEYYSVSTETFKTVKKSKDEKRRIIAVGSTVTRALEAMVRHGWGNPCLKGETDLFICPGYRFNVVDGLVTNFHLPKSTLLMLVSAFAGRDFIMKAYEEAVRLKYRFFSYGDAMMIV